MNTASRMATHGKPSRIHISTTTCALILHVPEDVIKERGIVDLKVKEIFTKNTIKIRVTENKVYTDGECFLKGKGKKMTFWLSSAEEYYSAAKNI